MKIAILILAMMTCTFVVTLPLRSNGNGDPDLPNDNSDKEFSTNENAQGRNQADFSTNVRANANFQKGTSIANGTDVPLPGDVQKDIQQGIARDERNRAISDGGPQGETTQG